MPKCRRLFPFLLGYCGRIKLYHRYVCVGVDQIGLSVGKLDAVDPHSSRRRLNCCFLSKRDAVRSGAGESAEGDRRRLLLKWAANPSLVYTNLLLLPPFPLCPIVHSRTLDTTA